MALFFKHVPLKTKDIPKIKNLGSDIENNLHYKELGYS